VPIALRFWQHTRGVPPETSSDQTPQNPKTRAISESGRAVASLAAGHVPSRPFDVVDEEPRQ
jgi:hypothetical protein